MATEDDGPEDYGHLEMQGKEPYSSLPNEERVAESFWNLMAPCDRQ